MPRADWEVVIGLEIHVQLLTQSKIFSGASTRFGADPNTQACAIDLGLPGVLPVVNEEVYKRAVTFGLGVGANINTRSVFDRKNYFYPDLPKGYQITNLATQLSREAKSRSHLPMQPRSYASPVRILRKMLANLCTKIFMARQVST